MSEFRGDRRDHVPSSQRVDAMEILQKGIERKLEYEQLPSSINIDQPDFSFMGAEDTTEPASVLKLTDLLDQEAANNDGIEHGCALVWNVKEQKFVVGPFCKGDHSGVEITAPLSEHEVQNGLLWTVEYDKKAALIHTHPNELSFSLQDIYAHVAEKSIQEYVILPGGTIHMMVNTQDSTLIERGLFERLLALWDSYLNPDGTFRSDMGVPEHDAFLRRISKEMKIGFYSNENSDDPAILELLK